MIDLFDAKHYLRLTPFNALIQIINDQMYAQLEEAFAEIIDFTLLGNQRVKVVIKTRRSKSNQNILPPLDTVTATFKRLLLTDVFDQGMVFSDLKLPFSTLDIIERLSVLKDVQFDLRDIKHETFDEYPTGPIVINTLASSLRFEGSLSVTVTNGKKMNLSLFQGVEVPSVFTYPNADTEKAQGYYYTNPFDFSKQRDALIPLRTGINNTLEGPLLASYMTALTGEEWVCSPEPAPRNIAFEVDGTVGKYRVRYHGDATERYTARTDLRNVIVLDLSETLCTDVAGAIRLHYD